MAVRPAVVAGMFYESSRSALRAQIERCFRDWPGPGRMPAVDRNGPRRIVGLIAPHAGLMYSGYAAAHAYGRLAADGALDVAVILCPNHYGLGADIALWGSGAWETPLGSVPVANDVARAILDGCPEAREDPMGHIREHGVEVQLPFLQVLWGNEISFVPIAMKAYSLSSSRALGQAIATAVDGRNAVVIASSDFTHYEPADVAARQDEYALAAVEDLDPEGLFDRVGERGITMCGCGPVAAMLTAARAMGASRVERLAYMTSGDVTGDRSRVVAYAAAAICR